MPAELVQLLSTSAASLSSSSAACALASPVHAARRYRIEVDEGGEASRASMVSNGTPGCAWAYSDRSRAYDEEEKKKEKKEGGIEPGEAAGVGKNDNDNDTTTLHWAQGHRHNKVWPRVQDLQARAGSLQGVA